MQGGEGGKAHLVKGQKKWGIRQSPSLPEPVPTQAKQVHHPSSAKDPGDAFRNCCSPFPDVATWKEGSSSGTQVRP